LIKVMIARMEMHSRRI